jgi:hypothetical protein
VSEKILMKQSNICGKILGEVEEGGPCYFGTVVLFCMLQRSQESLEFLSIKREVSDLRAPCSNPNLHGFFWVRKSPSCAAITAIAKSRDQGAEHSTDGVVCMG